MLTNRYINEMVVYALRSPLTLCDRLGLRPTKEQYKMLVELAEEPKRLDIDLGEDNQAWRVGAMYLLWRVLANEGSKGTVISSDQVLGAKVMGFLYNVTTKIDPSISSAVRWPKWNRLKIGPDSGHEIRLVPNKPVFVSDRVAATHTVLVLGAGSSDPAFVETRMALKNADLGDKASVLHLW